MTPAVQSTSRQRSARSSPRDRQRFRATAAALFANDDALYVGVSMTQHAVVCSNPACHVPLGMPGALDRVDGKPHRIFATPFP